MNYLKKPGILILTSFVVACGLAGCGGSASEPIVDTPVTPEPEVSSNLECDAVAYPCSLAEVPQDVLQASEDVSSEILTRLQAGDDSQAVVDWLSSLTDVVDASGDDLAITFRLNGGRPVWIFRAKSLAQNVESVNAPGAAATPHIPLSLAAMIDAVESLPSSGSSAAQSTSASAHQAIFRKVVGQSATEKSALILSPFKHQFGNFDEGTSLVQILQATRGYENRVMYKENPAKTSQNITLDDFRNWTEFDVIHLSTHGNTACNDIVCSGVISTGIAYSSAEELLNLLVNGVHQTKFEGDDVSYLSLGADFFRTEYPLGLADSLIFVSACRTFGLVNGQENSSLADALQGDTSIYLGWDGITNSATAKASAEKFYQSLADNGVEVSTAYGELGELLQSEGVYQGEPVVSHLILGLRPAGGDLRLREIASLKHPTTNGLIEAGNSIRIEGAVSDGVADALPYRISVDGVRAEAVGQFTVHLSVNGQLLVSANLATGAEVAERTWEVEGTTDLGFDVAEGQSVTLRTWVDLPDQGISAYQVPVILTDEEPLTLTFMSTMVFSWPGVGSSTSTVQANVSLSPEASPNTFSAAAQLLDYVSHSRTIANSEGCTVDIEVTDGTFEVPSGIVSGAETELIVLPDGVSERIVISCGSSADPQNTIDWLAGWRSFHGGVLAGTENETDVETRGWLIRQWEIGSDGLIARKIYSRSAPGPVGGTTFTENTTIEIWSTL